jgi:hypothetical protein
MRKVDSWYLGSHSPEIRFVKLLCTTIWLNERDIGQEGVRPRPDRRRLGQDMGARRGPRRLGLYLRVRTGLFFIVLSFIDITSLSLSFPDRLTKCLLPSRVRSRMPRLRKAA